MFRNSELMDCFRWSVKLRRAVLKDKTENVCCNQFIQILKYNAKGIIIYSEEIENNQSNRVK